MKAKEIIESVRGQDLKESERSQRAVDLAACIVEESNRTQTAAERKLQRKLAKFLEHPDTKNFTIALADQCFRSGSKRRAADQLIYLLNRYGAPAIHREISLFRFAGASLTSLFMPYLKESVIKETRGVILPGEEEKLGKHLSMRHGEGFRINLNRIGEAVHGEKEADRRLQAYLSDLDKPEVECISVKVSTIYSQINLLAWEGTAALIRERLKLLYLKAHKEHFIRPNGIEASKFVNLDMEEYCDLHLTVDVFCRTLDDPDLLDSTGGIALQAYLPDSYAVLQKLTAWAGERIAKGGAPVKVRLVKGANLAMERVESALRGWPAAPYGNKEEVDANFKRMLHFALQREHAQAVRIGVASHNIFDVAYALILRAEKGVEEFVEFEMLEGMAGAAARTVKNLSGDMILYCPAVEERDFEDAIAYLTRRLDENTASHNYLRHAFNMKPDSPEWERQVERFNAACQEINRVSSKPRRTQDRTKEPSRPEPSCQFRNEPDTDWSLLQNRKWAEKIIEKYSGKTLEAVPVIKTEEQIEKLFAKAKTWGKTPPHVRAEVLEEAAQLFRHYRGDLIGTMVSEGKKTIPQADVEISEAIDFIDYYRRMVMELPRMEDIRWSPKGIALITPPWNFPCSIPTGGIAAALAGGNAVLFKPAPEAERVGYLIAKIFWEAGIAEEQLQFISCDESDIGAALVEDERVNLIILTGATETAEHFKQLRPGVDLIAETGGKNSIIVTAMADRDLAIASAIDSAFSHAGQKCSACSLLILEAEVYDSEKFQRQLRDAAASLRVGSQWDPATKVNPLVRAPNEKLLRGLIELEPGEEWLLEPKQLAADIWTPGIKWGVKPGSFTQTTELFGPVLGVMRAEDLDHAIELANATRYGLTAGLQTLDDREKEKWTALIEAGNLYINRGITGAIVQRQPFGGCKASSFGRGSKAGGPNYLFQMMHAEQGKMPKKLAPPDKAISALFEEQDLWTASIGSYTYHWQNYFSKDHDPSCILGQDNILRYVPHRHMALRVQNEDNLVDILRIVAAAKICGTKLQISSEKKLPILFVHESEETFIERIRKGEITRVRMIGKPSALIASAPCNIVHGPVLANGRLELLHYLREVSISSDYHRYGNLGDREEETRAQLPTSTSSPQKCSL